MSRPFKWQINASAVGKLLGYFGKERQQKAIAECWLMNIKRMPRFGVTPSEIPQQKTTDEIVQQELRKPVYNQLVQKAVTDDADQPSVTRQIVSNVSNTVASTKRKYEETISEVKKVEELKEMPVYPTKKSGVKRAAVGSFFSANGKVYKKVSRKKANISTVAYAKLEGYRTVEAKLKVQKEMTIAKKEAETAQLVSKHVEKQATKTINTTRGIQRELSDLELVRRRFPSCRAGNDRAYFRQISGMPFRGFVIGRIDGIASGIIFELKHRQARLFNELRRYEQVQCILYMKMVKIPSCMLVETYQGQQIYYEMKLTMDNRCHYRKEGSEWKEGISFDVLQYKLNELIRKLNRIEIDVEYRNIMKNYLF
tara:strand:- start:6792 stop:7895 length:1104 start_codon:yes stop_codon:yes gene_type:complete